MQAALINAQPGDVLSLQAGATFTGNFVLPPKPAGAIITIRSSATLPNRRMTAGDSALMPLLQPATVEPAVACTNSSNWTFDGIRFGSNPGGIYDVVGLDGCTNITFDRVIIIGGPQGQKRGIRANGRNITLTRSHIANIWAPGQDSQAFCAWNGAGPFTMVDNYLEAASENVMFGGANSSSPANVPADILVENNHFNKRPEWRGDHPSSVKNLFELKSAKRAIIRNNLFEQNWTDAQNGYAILFTVRNDDGGAPWSVVEDVLFERQRRPRRGERLQRPRLRQLPAVRPDDAGDHSEQSDRDRRHVPSGRRRSGDAHTRSQHGRPGLHLHDALQRRRVGRRHQCGAARAVRGRKPHRDQHARQSQRVWVDWRGRGHGHTRTDPAGPQLYLDEQRVGRRKYRHSIPAVHVAADDGGVPGAVQRWLQPEDHEHLCHAVARTARRSAHRAAWSREPRRT